MKLTKIQRQQIKEMYGGRCAYCGDILTSSWQADHLKPIIRDASGCRKPENDVFENLVPACRSCNKNKSSMSIEDWRNWLQVHVDALGKHNRMFMLCKRFALVTETNNPVIFYSKKFK